MKNLIHQIFEKRPMILFEITFWLLVVLLVYAVLASFFGWPYIDLSA